MNKHEKVLGKMYSGDIKALLYKLRRPRESRTGGENRKLLSWLDEILQQELDTRHAVKELENINMRAGKCRPDKKSVRQARMVACMVAEHKEAWKNLEIARQEQDCKQADCAKAMKERVAGCVAEEKRVYEKCGLAESLEIARQEEDFKDQKLGRVIGLNCFRGERIESQLQSAIISLHNEGFTVARIELNKRDWNELLDRCAEGEESLRHCSAVANGDEYCNKKLVEYGVMREIGTGLYFRRLPVTRGESTKFFFGKPE